MPKKIPQDVLDRVLPTYKACTSYAEVANTLGISSATVGRIVRKSGYDRYHVGGVISRDIPVNSEKPARRNMLRAVSRTVKLKSDITGLTYTVSTELDTVEIESDTALMQIGVGLLGQFMDEIKNIQSMVAMSSKQGGCNNE